MKILIADAFDAKLPERLAQFGAVTGDMAQLKDAEVLLVRSKTKVTKELLEAAPALKLVIRGGVGLDNVDKEACKARGITVKNTPKASSVAVAELAMALMLAVPNRIIEAHNSMKEGKFLKSELKRTELFKKTLLVVGGGLIGREVMKRAKAFGMKVIACDPFVKECTEADQLTGDLHSVLGAADYISIHTPLTDETKGMFNSELFSKMKDGVILINTGRGKVIVEQDLADALKSGKVRHYATDVWFSDPPPAGSPLLSAPNVLMTPHIGASSKENLGRIGDCVVEILSEKNH
ncbi:MAG: hydroxyacid dehydrogenase [Myxococcota bacterium]|jgi:D-3-phosphoglycerate dehydrogenase